MKVLPHYAKTWMSLDVSMLCVDWAEVAIGGVGSLNAARMGKTVKSLRMIRMMRLWRLLNVNRLPDSVRVLIHHYFQSEVSRIVLDICKILLFLVWINHVLACCWYGIADSVTADDNSWLQSPQFQDQKTVYLYVTCFHWSLTQFVQAWQDITQEGLTWGMNEPLRFARWCFASFSLRQLSVASQPP